ncbi:MAG: FAD-dependent monooxygenase [Burkholderiales bacterium]
MQYHLNGHHPGDPRRQGSVDQNHRISKWGDIERVDVLIVGAGPAGLTLAAFLTKFPGLNICLIEKRPGRLLLGQADGVACRSMETFEALGFSWRVLEEAYWVNETAFWESSREGDNLIRKQVIREVEEGISHQTHVILSQARVQDFLLDVVGSGRSPTSPYYSKELIDIERTCRGDGASEELTATVKDLDTGSLKKISPKFIVGCDGARSAVRACLKIDQIGDRADKVWGVMDVLLTTDFPDIRRKSIIRSKELGSLLIIPREGGYMVRLYIELDLGPVKGKIGRADVTADYLISKAKAILSPFEINCHEIVWWSAYEIGQRIATKFDDRDIDKNLSPRVFLAGDACHTHSPKAGQGMNVSIQDGFNLGWKLGAVLSGVLKNDILKTYSEERWGIANELIEFDKVFSEIFGAQDKKKSVEVTSDFEEYFIRHGRYTAGVMTKYPLGLLTADRAYQTFASGFEIGTRLHSYPVLRVSDSKQMEIGQVLEADGRWRLLVFCPSPDLGGAVLAKFCEFLGSDKLSPLVRYTSAQSDVDSFIDVRFIFQGEVRDVDLDPLPEIMLPKKGKYGLVDYEKVFCARVDSAEDIFSNRGINREMGCVIIVRPDQHIADVCALDGSRIIEFFNRICVASIR